MKFLIVEDDTVTRKMMEFMLGKLWGFEFDSVKNGQEAISSLTDRSYELILLDWMMPVMDGIGVLNFISENFSYSKRPYIIMVTTRDQGEDIVHALDSGADDFISKPFDKEELLARIRVGARFTELRSLLNQEIQAFKDLTKEVVMLKKVVPVCMHCRKFRTEEDMWISPEEYFNNIVGLFSHGICPECQKEHYADQEEVP